MADYFTPEDDSFAKILLVTANFAAAKQVIKALSMLYSSGRYGDLHIAVIPAYYSTSVFLDMLGEVQCLISDRTVRHQDPSTGVFSTIKIEDLLWDARRHKLNLIETFLPERELDEHGAEIIARSVLASLRDLRLRSK